MAGTGLQDQLPQNQFQPVQGHAPPQYPVTPSPSVALVTRKEVMQIFCQVQSGKLPVGVVDQIYCKDPLFELPLGFQYPNLPKYAGKTIHKDFISEFLRLTRTYQHNSGLRVHLLRVSLEGGAKAWMNSLSRERLSNFNGLVQNFIDHF